VQKLVLLLFRRRIKIKVVRFLLYNLQRVIKNPLE